MLAVLALGWAVGKGSTPVDSWFARQLPGLVGQNPRWLLVFTSWWLFAPALGAALAVAVRRRRWQLALAIVVLPLVAMLVNARLKRIFDRRNGPYVEYPSGHTTLLVVVMGLLVLVATRRLWTLAAATALSLLGALGLVACGYHYLTDTIGSALLGSALVGMTALLVSRERPRSHAVCAALAIAAVTGVNTTALASAAPEPEPSVPAVSTTAQAAGFVDVRSAVPDAIIDLRYATPDNFLRTPLYPPDARCLVHQSLAPGLTVAADALRQRGRVLVFWDCYRPHHVQVAMFQAVPDPNFVARPGPFARSHVAGRSVDVTLADPAAQCPAATQLANRGCLVDMGTDFDDFTPRAAAFATAGIGDAAVTNRMLLRQAMTAGGFAAYPAEWWHFDGPGAGVERSIPEVEVG